MSEERPPEFYEPLDPLPCVPLAKVRKQLTELIHIINRNEVPYVITHYGKPTAVLLDVEDFLNLVSRQGASGQAFSSRASQAEKVLDYLNVASAGKVRNWALPNTALEEDEELKRFTKMQTDET